jgi:hypothetical protein
MPTTRKTPAYIVAAAQRLADAAPEFDEQTLVLAFTSLGATVPEQTIKNTRRAA